ncbi:MAG: ABC transporter permease [Candidatus Cloacimonetes bacterium]|nr:ABC transporter permease [Candidatus Cloacimonadota bacterium]
MANIKDFFLIGDLHKYRNLFFKLVYRDFFEKFVGSVLGLIWAIINPLVLMGMYILLFSVILKIKFHHNQSHIDFGVYLFCGMIPWISFQDSILKSSNSIINFRNLIHQIKFPLSFLPLHLAVSSAIQECIALVLFILFLIWHQDLRLAHLWVLLIIFPIKWLFTCGINFFIAAGTIFYRDLAQVLQILMMTWFFASPIVYPISKIPETWRFVYDLNPFVHFVSNYRLALLNQGTLQIESLIYLSLFSILFFCLGLRYFHKNKSQFGLYL